MTSKSLFSPFLVGCLSVVMMLSACEKDDSSVSDNELFSRLESGSGTWQVVQVDEWNNTQENPNVTTSYPENDFFHFYIKSSVAFSTLISIETGDTYVNGNLVESRKVEAETERVAFVGPDPGVGVVWTVEENRLKKQTWLRVYGEESMRIMLKKCDCELPGPPGETGG